MKQSTLIKNYPSLDEVLDRMNLVLSKPGDIIFHYGSILVSRLDEDDYFADTLRVRFGVPDFTEFPRERDDDFRPAIYSANSIYFRKRLNLCSQNDLDKVLKMAQTYDFFFRSIGGHNYLITCVGNHEGKDRSMMALYDISYDHDLMSFRLSSVKNTQRKR